MQTSRREFMKASAGGIALAATSPALTSCSPTQAAKPIPPGGKVAVIGAGFAGLGAAQRLQETGHEVVLVDARDRVGGRAHSVSLDGFPADLGPNWLRVSDNALMPIAEELGLVSQKTDLSNSIIIEKGNRSQHSAGELETALEPMLTQPYLRYQAKLLVGARPQAGSAEALIGSGFADNALLQCAGRRLISGVYAADLEDLSGDVLIGAGAEAGPSAAELTEPTVVGGMQALAEALAASLTPSLGEQVSSIARTENGVQVTTNRRIIEADAAILTASVGVLKKNSIRIEPGLPQAHQDALAGMDMGCFAKLWIRYPEASWDIDTDLLVPCDIDDIHAIVDFSKSHGAPVLLAYAAGKQGRTLEAMADEDAKSMLHAIVQEQLKVSLPEPTGFAKNAWTRDPLAWGAYMYPNTQFRAGDNIMLREPIAERILLAGEALAGDFGYVDTAWSDGRRAADLIISTS